ncbi:hypothetical protein Q4E93_01215 [Flavitalea sp. BT771]|uniref:hypothetical protein n=1 Tax=Flavitalea sp. BT771 TaxID=3063329 RepID=UPI0026E239FF|nr:hypothetical protein [Flavitalea sp. BT771]MDO6429186.1 hypothetical protein [Flavitalea sp. BT771]MDV6218686.1 hypothetical protein [Flavitalea sp. BT771]
MRFLTSTLILPAFLLAFSSCRTYQYFTLDSPEVPKNSKGDLSWENDTLRLEYGYAGEGGPVWMSIHNKTDKPLYINWKKSAFIKGAFANSLFNPNTQFSASFVGSRGYINSSGSLAGSFQLPEGVDFIPPGIAIARRLSQTVQASSVDISKIDGKPRLQKQKRQNGATHEQADYAFDKAASPLQFKLYLTFVLGNSSAEEFAISHSFYARGLTLTSEKPWAFSPYMSSRGDEFFVK